MFDLDALFDAPRERPAGVKFVAILVCIQGIFNLFVAIFFIITALLGGSSLTTRSAIVGAVVGILIGLVGLVMLFLAWGLWTLKRWAYWATLILMTFEILSSVFEFKLPVTGIWTIWGELIIPAVVLIYFLAASNVRKAFLA